MVERLLKVCWAIY